MELTKSKATFDEALHRYERDGERLSGITSLIHDVLQLGVYPDANEYTWKYIIPQAGYRGTCVHNTIQIYEEMGIDCTQYAESKTKDGVTLEAVDTSVELEAYKATRPANMAYVCSEFLIDYGQFASSVDAIWGDLGGGVVLVDHKTNNLDYYPGGKDALKEYLSWQLSCYAYMFEQQTGVEVSRLVGHWIRDNKSEWWPIKRISNRKVKQLLDTKVDWVDGKAVYTNEKMQVAPPEPVVPEVVVSSQTDLVTSEVIDTIRKFVELEKAAKKMREQLREAMVQAGISKWECDAFTATIEADSTTTRFDAKALEAEHPRTYKKYLTTAPKKGAFKIKLK